MLPQKHNLFDVFKGHFVPHYQRYNLGRRVVNMKIKFEWIVMTLSLFLNKNLKVFVVWN